MDYCPNCGAKVSSSDKRCKKCGHELKNNSSKLIIGVIIAVVIIAIAGILASGMFSQDINDSTVADTSNNQNSVSEDISNDDSSSKSSDKSSSGDTVYWASAKTDKFHLPTCEWGQKIDDSNKIVFNSREDALASGREPCSVCNP